MDREFIESPRSEKLLRAKTLTQGCYDPKNYEFDSSFRPYDPNNGLSVHTTFEMLEYLQNHPESELDAKVLGWDEKQGKVTSRKMDKKYFFESFQSNAWDHQKLHEVDMFAQDYSPNSGIGFGIGHDFQPLLGGPFFKNLYYYQDYIRMHSECFYAHANDAIAKAITDITKNFVIGTGFEVQCKDQSDRGQLAMATWKAFEEANDLQNQIDQACDEISVYGEIMIWKLPDLQTKIIYRLRPGDTIPLGVIPRVKLIDPSNIVEVVTYPESIDRPLFFVWLAPTQWQMFTSGLGEGRPTDLKSIQSTLKFIYRTIPADQMLHFKINCMSNEKRGRSDYFPILSYLKRLRDTVDYQLIALQKAAAWAIDTSIDGDQTDIDGYISDQAAMGTIPPAGSEFIHTTKIKREYISNQGSKALNSEAFSLALSMICAGIGIPVSYMGTHLSGGSTRASALVATEPVAKKMEKRREVIKRIIVKLWDYCMQCAGIPNMECQVVFPELITQDRGQKLKDIMMCQTNRWISPARAASLAAKELGIDDYDYDSEIQKMATQFPEIPMPLTDPAIQGGTVNPTPQPGESEPESSGMDSNDKQDIKQDDTRVAY
jgi:hypothetical protein